MLDCAWYILTALNGCADESKLNLLTQPDFRRRLWVCSAFFNSEICQMLIKLQIK